MAEENDASTAKDEGGYWLGTDKRQNEGVLSASLKRQSIIDVQESHGAELQAMQDRFPGVPVHDLVRFLKARDFNLKKATEMHEAHHKWRKETLPRIPKEDALCLQTLSTRKFYMLDDLDESGRPIIFYCLHRFKDMPYVVEDEIQALLYLLEHSVIPRFGPSFERQKLTVLIDVSGIRSPPLSFLQQVNTVMEANYPESLFLSVMFPVPYWLQKVIQGCLAFVAEETRSKFAYVNDVKSLEEFAGTPLRKMGPDIADLVKTKQLKK